MRTEEPVEEEAEASIEAVVLVSTRLLLTVLKIQEEAKIRMKPEYVICAGLVLHVHYFSSAFQHD